jgi:hypothetical protein
MRTIATCLFLILSWQSYRCQQTVVTNTAREYFVFAGTECMRVMTRDHLNDSVFVDRMWSDSGKVLERVDTFKVIGQNWYYKINDTFCAFFSEALFNSGSIIRMYYDCNPSGYNAYSLNIETFKPFRKETADGKTTYVYLRLYSSSTEGISDLCYNCSYFFDPDNGAIRIQGESCGELRREKVEGLPVGWKLKE